MAIPHLAFSPLADRIRERVSQRLARLCADLEEGELCPSDAAQQECLEKLVAAAALTSPVDDFPFPHLDTGGEGDLSCEWQGEQRVVWFLIAPRGDSALHRVEMQDGRVASRETTPIPTADQIRAAIEWFMKAESSSP
jgi:hypothetical protein